MKRETSQLNNLDGYISLKVRWKYVNLDLGLSFPSTCIIIPLWGADEWLQSEYFINL